MVFSQELKQNIRPTYQSRNLIEEFYSPTLSEAKLYKRVSAYFSSEGLELYSKGLDQLFNNDGCAQFIISTDISEEDFNKITEGYQIRESLEKLAEQLRQTVLNNKTKEYLGNLSYMIAKGHAEVKFALVPNGRGIFHDKFGLINSDSDTIFFNGSVNETRNGLELNYESISVDVSWDSSSNVTERIKTNELRFDRLWNNEENDVLTLDATALIYSELKKYQKHSTLEELEMDLPCVSFVMEDGTTIVREDNSSFNITNTDRYLKPGSDMSNKYFQNDNSTIKSEFSYMDILHVIKLTQKRCERRNIDRKSVV